ncbi:MAG: hypothetical protein ACRDI2_21375, partial [Chloroflexota bacterium]
VGQWHHHLSYDEEAHFRAVEYLRARGVVRDQPFFLCVSYHHPHEPFWPPRSLWDLYEDAEIDTPSFPDNLEDTYSVMDRWLNTLHNVRAYPQLRDRESVSRVRRGRYKYVHIHGVDAQLFDLELDPGEWHNLAGQPQHRGVEEALRMALLARFPMDAIEQDIRRTIATRLLIDRAMKRTGTLWDYASQFDPSHNALQHYLQTGAARPGRHH